MVWRLPVRLDHREPHLSGDVTGIRAPCPEVEGPTVLMASSLLLDIVHCTALAQRLCSHLLRPAVDRNSLNAYLDSELPVDVGGVAALVPGAKVEDAAAVGEDPHVHHALPERRVGEDDEVALGEVLDHLEVIVVQIELASKGIAEVVVLRVMAAAVDPTHSHSTNELVPAPADGASGRHRTEAVGRPSPWVAWVPSDRHHLLPTDHLCKGAVVGLMKCWKRTLLGGSGVIEVLL